VGGEKLSLVEDVLNQSSLLSLGAASKKVGTAKAFVGLLATKLLETTFSSAGEESLSTAAAAAVSSCAALFLLRQLENLSFLCSSDKT